MSVNVWIEILNRKSFAEVSFYNSFYFVADQQLRALQRKARSFEYERVYPSDPAA